MTIADLRKQFIVDDDVLQTRLETIIGKALKHCVVDRSGSVHFNDSKLGPKERIKLAIAARGVACQLDPKISAEMTVADLATTTGVPKEQVRARASDLVKEKFAVAPKAGVVRAIPHKIEAFLDELSE